MIHIDKNQPISQEGRDFIQTWKNSPYNEEKSHEIHLQSLYSNDAKTGDNLWGLMTDKKPLKRSLVLEQGFVCCYCGRRIFNDHNTLNEHLLPKGEKKYKEKTFDYDNLMACCYGSSKKIIHLVKSNEETIEAIAQRYAIPVIHIETLYVDDKNYKIIEKAYDIEKLQAGDKVLIIKPLEAEYQHCGPKKDIKVIDINPIQLDCAQQFKYEQGKYEAMIIPFGENTAAQTTIQKLNLNGNPALNRERHAAIDKALRVRTKIMQSVGDKRVLLNKEIQFYERASDKHALAMEMDAAYFKEPFWFVITAVLKNRLNLKL